MIGVLRSLSAWRAWLQHRWLLVQLVELVPPRSAPTVADDSALLLALSEDHCRIIPALASYAYVSKAEAEETGVTSFLS